MASEERSGRYLSLTRAGGVATLRVDRGDGTNALSLALIRDLTAAARAFDGDLETHAIVLTGVGAFSAGADLEDPELRGRAAAGLLERRHLLKAGPEMCDAWERVEPVTLAAIERFCIGGALSLAVACDFRVMGRSAHLRLPEIPLGMNMSWRTLPRLVSLIGPSRTKQLTIFGERVGADEALAWGLVDRVVDDGVALPAALEWAAKIAALPPVPVRMSKQSINATANALHHATSFMDLDQFALVATGEDQREALAAFLGKRAPKFTGR